MSEIKQENNRPSKYQELNDYELEIVCGGACGTPFGPPDCEDGPVKDDPELPREKL
ncbi:hypothetical protein IQ255_28240 [Pleurocapsales cyanobacterium LEGE 10410]|nr:hypothetical protein [Pleurocapsales cyanobacterium LEGE 10410]